MTELSITITISPNNSDAGTTVTFSHTGNTFDFYYWQFGDGYDSYLSSPTHVYETEGTYNVSLKACNTDGSDWGHDTEIMYVNQEGYSLDFYARPRYGKIPLEVEFCPIEPEGVLSYYWDFGDGTTSTDRYPVHTYTNAQSYSVHLRILTDSGYLDTLKEYYVFASEADPPVSGFYVDHQSGMVPLTVQFTDASTGFLTGSWDFGNGDTSIETNPSYTFSVPGFYYVKRSVSTAEYEDETVQLIHVRDLLTVRILASPKTGFSPLTALFKGVISGKYRTLLWDFDDGTTSTSENPTHTFAAPGTYDVTLTVWQDTVNNPVIGTLSIIVKDPALLPGTNFTADITTGNAPFTVTFTDTTTGTVTSRLWDFGDDTTSVLVNPVHIYTVPGTYTVTLTAYNSYGQKTMEREDYITVTAAPVASFTADREIGYDHTVFTFTDSSTNNPTSWLWDFGDGTTSEDQNPTHTFTGSVTSEWVTLTVTNAHGTDTIGMDIYIVSDSYPIPDFTYTFLTLTTPVTIQFTDTSESAAGTPEWVWDFGDGETSTDQNPVHTYRYPGEYVVSLTITRSTYRMTIKKRIEYA